MLVLSRKVGDRIRIGDNIEITVSEIRGNVIRLGITAPADVRILRGELLSWDAEPASEPAAQDSCRKAAPLASHSDGPDGARRHRSASGPRAKSSATKARAAKAPAAKAPAPTGVVPWDGVTGNAMAGKTTG